MNFAQALAIYQAGDTAKAVKIWQQEVQGSAWTGEEKRLAYQYLLQIYPPTTAEHEQWRWELACCLEELKLWPQALELFYQDESLARLGTNLHHIWHCQICLGQVAAAAATATKLLAYYLRTKKIMLGLQFLAELKQTNFSSAEHLKFQIKFWQLQGNLAALAQVVPEMKHPAEILSELRNIADEPALLDAKLASFWPQLAGYLGSLRPQPLRPVQKTTATGSSTLGATIVELHRLNQAGGPLPARREGRKRRAPISAETLQAVLQLCREFLKTSYLKILFYPAASDFWPVLARYAQLFARPKLLGALKNIVTQVATDDAPGLAEMKTLLADVEAGALAVAPELPPAETMVGPCDMATDLFLQELTIADLKAARIKRMERDIAFLQRQGEKKKAAAILHSLQEIDEDNTMAYQAPAAAPKLSLAKMAENKSAAEILAYLDRQIEYFAASTSGAADDRKTSETAGRPVSSSSKSVYELSPSFSPSRRAARRAQDLAAEYRFQERYFQLYLKYLTPEEVRPIYRDLIYAWRALGMAQPGLALLEKMAQWRKEQQAKHPPFRDAFLSSSAGPSSASGRSTAPEDSLTLMAIEIQDIYLRAILLGDLGRYYEAIDLLEGQIRFAPLQRDEQVCFWYLLGEYYAALGKHDMAARAFQRVARLNKHYRLVQLRIKELEA